MNTTVNVECGKKLKTEVNLKKHISYVHNGRKTFKCSMCDAEFVRSGSLKTHIASSIHEENLSQPLQTNNKEFKIANTFLAGYNGIFNITDKNKQFFFQSPLNHFDEISISPGAYEIESLDLEIKRLIINRYAAMDDESYPFSI